MLFALVCLGCTSAPLEPPPPDVAPPKSVFAFETFNATLFRYDDDWLFYSRARAAALPDAIARSTADVMCVQQLWVDGDRRAVIEGAKGTFPFVIDLPSDDDTAVDDPRALDGTTPAPALNPPCADYGPEVAKLASCLTAACGSTLSSRSCAQASCDAEREAVPSLTHCRRCIDTLLSSGEPVTSAADRCRTAREPSAYRGGHGLLLLSRYPLSAAERRMFVPRELRTGALRATVALPNGARIDAFCTRLSWPDTGNRYFGRYGGGDSGYVQEHAIEVERLIEWTAKSPRAVVMAETNASVEHIEDGTRLVEGAWPSGLLRLRAAMTEALAPAAIPACTWCPGNALVRGNGRLWSSRIFLRGIERSAVTASHRTMLGATVRTPTGMVPLSGYFGYRATIAVPP